MPPFSNPSGARAIIKGVAGRVMNQSQSRVRRLGMTPRQQTLNYYWGIYRCQRYAARDYNWDGTRAEDTDPIHLEAMSRAAFTPPGMYSAGLDQVSLRQRKPSAPYNLAKVIVDRFTALLFSERHHPQIRVEGDPVTEDWLNAVAEVGRLMPRMMQVRQWGGATGTAILGFAILNGIPKFEVHDPRWAFPEFADRFSQELSRLEIRYQYPEQGFDPETGDPAIVNYWYRRVIDTQADIEWPPVPVGDGDEPDWDAIVMAGEAKVAEHNFGFVPAQWIQNVPVHGDIDGDPDCHAVFEIMEEIDVLLAQANVGIKANCDPTLVVNTDRTPEEQNTIRKGSRAAIMLELAGKASYLELNGSGPKAAADQAELLRRYALEVAQCVLEHPDVANRTATEVQRTYESMYARADEFREQYGERGIKPILEKMLQAARILQGRRQGITLPPKVDRDPETGAAKLVPRQVGPNGQIVKLVWPPYSTPSLEDVMMATRAAGIAAVQGLIDQEHAVSFTAPYYRVEDATAMLASIKREQKERQDQAAASAMSGISGFGGRGMGMGGSRGGGETGGMGGME